MSKVRVFNQQLLTSVLADAPHSPNESNHLTSSNGIARPGSPLKARPTSPVDQARRKQIQYLKDLEEQRQRRYDQCRRDAQAKAVDDNRQVREQIMASTLRREEKFESNFSSIMAGKDLSASIKKQQDLEDEAQRNKTVQFILNA
jgi:hypothetical protein